MNRIISLLIIIFAVASCKKAEEASENEVATKSNSITLSGNQLKSAGISTAKVEKKMISSTIKVNGVLDVPPQNLVTISAPMGGFVKQTHLLQGMHVKKGEVLAELEHQDYIQLQQDFLERRSQLDFLQTEYERQAELAKENVNSQKTLQQAKSQFESMKANVAGLTSRLSMINITPEKLATNGIQSSIKLYSPISGYVTEVNVNLGKFVSSTDMLFKIVDPSHLHAELYVFENDVPQLKIDQRVHFSLANESRVRIASIHLIGKEISADRTVRIHCHLDEDYPDLIPGMYLKAWVETGTKEAMVVPTEAVVNFEGTDYVFTTVDNKSFQMVPVKLGSTENGVIEIVQDDDSEKIVESTIVVVRGAYDLLSIMRNVEEEEE